MTQNIGRLGVVLGLDTAEFVRGLEKAKQSVASFASTQLPRMAAVGAAAFTAMTYKALQFADQISDVAKANEVSIETVLQLGQALTVSGGKASDASKLFASFSAQVDSAAQGSKQAQEMFNRVGVSLSDLANLTTEQLFDKTVQDLAKIDDALTRNALAAQIFGRAMKGVDIREVANQTKQGREEFIKYAEAIKEAGEFQDKFDTAINKITLSFTKNVLPTITRLAEELGKAGGVMESVFKAVDYFISHAAFGIRFLAGVVEATFQAFKSLALYLNDLMSLNFGTGKQRLDEYLAKTKEIQNEVEGFGKRLFMEPAPKPKVDTKAGRTVVDADAEAVKKAQELSVAFAKQQALKLDQLYMQEQFVELTQKEREIAEATYAIELDAKRQIADIEKQIAAEKAKLKPGETENKVIRALEEQKREVLSLAEAYQTLTRSQMQDTQAAQTTFEYGWNKALRQFSEDARDYSKAGEQAFNSIMSNMEQALDRFVETGKLNFKDLIGSMIKDLIKLRLQAQLTGMFDMLLGSLGLGGTRTTPAPISDISIMGTAADGGFIDGPTLVGEQGPELFIPKTPGTVIPNQQMGNHLGGDTYVTNNYINAIDTKSFEERLLGSSNAIWAANQYANKSLAVGRGRT